MRAGAGLGARMTGAWRSPWRAAAWTALFAVLCALVPLLRWIFPAAARAYEAVRHPRERALILRQFQEGEVIAGMQLHVRAGDLPLWEGPVPFADPPFCTQPIAAPYAAGAARAGTAAELAAALPVDDL